MIYNLATLKTSWLFLNIFMVILMVIIGGITRLTDSGLSMTEWKLISGIIPPLIKKIGISNLNYTNNHQNSY